MGKQKLNALNVGMNLHLDWCSQKAAKYAIEHWHYSKVLPVGDSVKIGVWENNIFKGIILFSRGANPYIYKPYNLMKNEVCELTRIALSIHITPVSQLVKIAIKLLKKKCPDLKLIISYADMNQNHIGIIYQAGNWIYTGMSKSTPLYFYRGRWMRQRQLSSLKNMSLAKFKGLTRKQLDKFRYLMPLDSETLEKIKHLQKPYPKKCGSLIEGQQAPPAEDGAIPILPLQIDFTGNNKIIKNGKEIQWL